MDEGGLVPLPIEPFETDLATVPANRTWCCFGGGTIHATLRTSWSGSPGRNVTVVAGDREARPLLEGSLVPLLERRLRSFIGGLWVYEAAAT